MTSERRGLELVRDCMQRALADVNADTEHDTAYLLGYLRGAVESVVAVADGWLEA
jgi:hypothetical protein